MDRQKKGDRLTGVWQNGGISAKLSICTSINISANLNICTSNPPLRQAPKRCAQASPNTIQILKFLQMDFLNLLKIQ